MEYNKMSIDDRQTVLGEVFDRAVDLSTPKWLPLPSQVSHCDFDNLPNGYQSALRELSWSA